MVDAGRQTVDLIETAIYGSNYYIYDFQQIPAIPKLYPYSARSVHYR